MMTFLQKKLPVLLLILLCGNTTFAVTYTAIASGSYSSSSTWQGGVVPPTMFGNGDVINIPQGITVSSASDITFLGMSALDLLTVNGILNMPNNTLRIEQLRLTGIGAIVADSFGGNFIHGFGYNGGIIVNRMDGSTLSANTNVVIDIADLLYVADSMQLDHGTINLGPNTLITLKGMGQRTTPVLNIRGSATMSFNGTYDVLYMGNDVIAGIELTDAMLKNITISMSGSQQMVLLNRDLDIKGKLHIEAGRLGMNGYDLKLSPSSNLEIGLTGCINTNTPTNIHIEATAPLTSPLKFHQANYTVDQLTVDVPGVVQLSSDLVVGNYLDIKKGKIDVLTNNLKMPDNFNFSGYDRNRYIITESGGTITADVSGTIMQPETVFFPVGTTTEYLPCLVTSANTYNSMAVGVTPGVKENGSTGTNWALTKPVVNATWMVGNTNNNIDVDLELTWFPTVEVNGFDKAGGVYVSHYTTANKWDTPAKQPPMSYTDGSYSAKRLEAKQWGYFAVFDKNTVGITDVLQQQGIKVYPNPATNVLHIDVQDAAHAYIYNTNGQQVQETEIIKGDNIISTSSLPAGMYFVKLSGGKVNAALSFVKQ